MEEDIYYGYRNAHLLMLILSDFSLIIRQMDFFQRHCVLPVVEDAVEHEPLHLDSVTVKLLLHVHEQRIFVLPLGALVIVTFASKVHRRRLVHVCLPLVVTEHHLAVQLQLGPKQGQNAV